MNLKQKVNDALVTSNSEFIRYSEQRKSFLGELQSALQGCYNPVGPVEIQDADVTVRHKAIRVGCRRRTNHSIFDIYDNPELLKDVVIQTIVFRRSGQFILRLDIPVGSIPTAMRDEDVKPRSMEYPGILNEVKDALVALLRTT